MIDKEILENNKLIAEFMDFNLPINVVHKLELDDDWYDDLEDGEVPIPTCNIEVRDFKNCPTYNHYKELEDPNNNQLVYKPIVLSYLDRYFIYGESGYAKSCLDSHPEITKDILPYANSYGTMYHESWDWLMPVVEKIGLLEINDGEIVYSWVTNDGFYIYVGRISGEVNQEGYYYEYLYYQNSDNMILNGKIENVYNAVVEFIKWYNENEKK